MEYIKKEDLKDGDVFVAQLSTMHFLNKYNTEFSLELNTHNRISSKVLYKNRIFSYHNMRLATPEEKHWINTCIEQDKFIEYDEAMKSFIPEYVKCIKPEHWKKTIKENNGNLIFKSDFKSSCTYQIKDVYHNNPGNFLPSTKEAYDAQFVVKEPEFILPEKWFIRLNLDNIKIVGDWFNKNKQSSSNDYGEILMNGTKPLYETLCFPGIRMLGDFYHGVLNEKKGHSYKEITFEQFKKYVLKEEISENIKTIEPLPQFKVIETIETITKVENNEGNQFFIGDVVKSQINVIQTIKSFKYNSSKTKILALTDKTSIIGININEIEHYIEPKVEVKDDFILPEKWCIEVTDINKEIINKLRKKNHLPKIKYKYCTSVQYSGHSLIYGTEITFDQFKKYVLKEEDKTESLLDKAKRLYPIGTKITSLSGEKGTIKTNFIHKSISPISGYKRIFADNGNYQIYSEKTNKWAEIIK